MDRILIVVWSGFKYIIIDYGISKCFRVTVNICNGAPVCKSIIFIDDIIFDYWRRVIKTTDCSSIFGQIVFYDRIRNLELREIIERNRSAA